jgi:hypothetical protein
MFEPETLVQAQATIKKLTELTQLTEIEIAELSLKIIDFKPAPTEWSVKEVVCHLRDVDSIFYDRCQRMLDDDDEPFLRAFNPDELAEESGYRRQIWEEVVREWQSNRQRNLDFYHKLPPIKWLRGAFHQERGHINLMDVANSLVDQSEMHLEQIRNNKRLATMAK